MAIKQTLEDSKARLDALLEFANNATGESDANIGDAIKTLVDGFGQGGGAYGLDAVFERHQEVVDANITSYNVEFQNFNPNKVAIINILGTTTGVYTNRRITFKHVLWGLSESGTIYYANNSNHVQFSLLYSPHGGVGNNYASNKSRQDETGFNRLWETSALIDAAKLSQFGSTGFYAFNYVVREITHGILVTLTSPNVGDTFHIWVYQ